MYSRSAKRGFDNRANNMDFLFNTTCANQDNLNRKSILFAGLLKLKFWFLGRSTSKYIDEKGRPEM